jgi:type IV secretory pathway TraG/TraD family ATPase VirD4
MVYQSRRQSVEIYGPDMASLIEEQSSVIQAWSVRAESDRKSWSARAGTRTTKARSVSRDASDANAPWRLSVSERGAPVLMTDHIAQLSDDRQIIAIDGKPLIVGEKVRYFQVEPWRSVAAPSPYHKGGYPKDKPVRFQVPS